MGGQQHGHHHRHVHHHHEERHRRRDEDDEHQSLRESIDTHGSRMSSFEKKAFARYQAQALQESDYMVKRILMKHDKAKHKEKRDSMRKGEEEMNTMHNDEEEDSMNKELGEEKKKNHEDRMNRMSNDDADMDEDLGESMGEQDCHHDGCFKRKSRKLGDAQGAAAQIEAEAKEVAEGKEPFSSEPVTNEDRDEHFVMTNKNRRLELNNAAYGKSESSIERQEARIAEKTEREKKAINLYESMDQKKRIADEKHARMRRYVAKKLEEHHLMRDSKGRVVPNV